MQKEICWVGCFRHDGLVTLAVEAVGSYLQKKRNKAMATAMDALHEVQLDTYVTGPDLCALSRALIPV